jgi:hypothetical protein
LKKCSGSFLPAGIERRRRGSGDLRVRVDALVTLLDMGKLMMVAPPSIGRRRLPDGKAARRSSPVHNDGAIQRARDGAKRSTRCRNSPGTRRSAQTRQRWPDGVAIAGGDGGRERRRWLGEVDLGRVGSIPGAGLASRGRRSSWRSRRGLGRLVSPESPAPVVGEDEVDDGAPDGFGSIPPAR